MKNLYKVKEKPVSAATEKSFKYKYVNQNIYKHSMQYSDTSIIPQNKKFSSAKRKINKNNIFADIFDQAKSRLDIFTVVKYYGVQPDNRSYALLCPFHSEKTASFTVYADTDSFYCYGCGMGGSVIDFVMKMFNLTNIDAVKRINADFCLNLPLSEKISEEEYKKSIQETQRRKENKSYIADFKQWEKHAFRIVSSYYKAIKDCGFEHTEYIESLVDMMVENTHDFYRQVEFYRNYGELVTDIEHRYL